MDGLFYFIALMALVVAFSGASVMFNFIREQKKK